DFIDAVRRGQNGNVPSDYLVRRITKDSLGGTVPTEDDSIQILGNDGVVGGFHDGAQTLLQIAYAFLRGNVHRYAAGMDKLSVLPVDAGTGGNPAKGAIFAADAGFIPGQRLIVSETGENIVDHMQIGVKLRDVMADIFIGRIPQ